MSVTGIRGATRAIETIKSGWTDNTAWAVGVGAEYGAYVEFGTSQSGAQPYLLPAARHVLRTQFDAIEEQANTLDDLVELLAIEIEAEAKRRAPVDTGNLRSSIEAFPVGAQP